MIVAAVPDRVPGAIDMEILQLVPCGPAIRMDLEYINVLMNLQTATVTVAT